MSQYRGVVQWFNSVKGFGFLSREGEADVFVHYSAIERDGFKTLKEGDLVEFDTELGSQGKEQAARVRRLAVTPVEAETQAAIERQAQA